MVSFMTLMTVQEKAHAVFMVFGQNIFEIYMKKNLSARMDCGDNNSILTQVSSGPEITLLCKDCYDYKYINEIKNEIIYDKEEQN